MARETENAGDATASPASALATVPVRIAERRWGCPPIDGATSCSNCMLYHGPVVKAAEGTPQDATFCGFVVKSASPKYVIRLVSQDGAETVNYRSSMDSTITPAKAHNAVLRASVGDSVRATVNSVGIIRSFEIISKLETVTGTTPGIKPGAGDKVEPKKQLRDGMVKEHRAAKRKNRAQVQDAPSVPQDAPSVPQDAPSVPQDAPSTPARTRCPFCRGPIHESMLAEVQCANAMRFARRANKRTRVTTTTDDDNE